MAEQFSLKSVVQGAERTSRPSQGTNAPNASGPPGNKPAKAPLGPAATTPAASPRTSSTQGELDKMQNILLEMGVKPSHVHIAMARARSTGEPLAKIMRDFGFLSGEQVAEAVSKQSGLPHFTHADIDGIRRDDIAKLDLKEFRGFVPVGYSASKRLRLAIPEMGLSNDARNTFHAHPSELVIASEHTIQTVFRRFFARTEDAVDAAVKEFEDKVERGRQDDEDEFSSGYVRNVLFSILRHACYAGASDIYFFKSEYVGVVKLKINGVGTLFRTLSAELYDRVLNKLIADNAKSEDLRREPKETFVQFNDDDQKRLPDIVIRWGFRLELAETRGKRTAVIRLLDKNSAATDIDKLGFDETSYDYIKTVSNTSDGFFLVTGPTGSGKTTTLYALLKSIDPVERSVQSIENPIEYTHGLWMQYEVRKDATNEGEEYNKWLKALLRNAPDVILVGEVRDRDVANISLNAANTGHLVFATLHTNNAVLALGRLRSLNLDQNVLASVLLGILAQRLIRTLCLACREPDTTLATRKLLEEEESYLGNALKPFRAGRGCSDCDYTGYRGRRMIYEVLRVTPAVREAIELNEPPTSIARKGMRPDETIWACGMRLVAQGLTSMDELKRVASKVF